MGRKLARKSDEDSDYMDVVDLSCEDKNVPPSFPFDPPRPSGVYIPEDVDPNSPIELFKLFFDAEIVDYICNASNEYVESEKEKRPAMYCYYKSMTRNDFYKLLGVIIHLGYRRIPRYRLTWSPASLCYDPFLSEVMSRNHFESMMSFSSCC